MAQTTGKGLQRDRPLPACSGSWSLKGLILDLGGRPLDRMLRTASSSEACSLAKPHCLVTPQIQNAEPNIWADMGGGGKGTHSLLFAHLYQFYDSNSVRLNYSRRKPGAHTRLTPPPFRRWPGSTSSSLHYRWSGSRRGSPGQTRRAHPQSRPRRQA